MLQGLHAARGCMLQGAACCKGCMLQGAACCKGCMLQGAACCKAAAVGALPSWHGRAMALWMCERVPLRRPGWPPIVPCLLFF